MASPPDGGEIAGAALAAGSAGFPERFSAALEGARGAIAGIESAHESNGLLDRESLLRLQEIYRLRVELQLESASILWRASQAVRALSEASVALSRLISAAPTPAPVELVEERRARIPARRLPHAPSIAVGAEHEPADDRAAAFAGDAAAARIDPGPAFRRIRLGARAMEAEASGPAWDDGHPGGHDAEPPEPVPSHGRRGRQRAD